MQVPKAAISQIYAISRNFAISPQFSCNSPQDLRYQSLPPLFLSFGVSLESPKALRLPSLPPLGSAPGFLGPISVAPPPPFFFLRQQGGVLAPGLLGSSFSPVGSKWCGPMWCGWGVRVFPEKGESLKDAVDEMPPGGGGARWLGVLTFYVPHNPPKDFPPAK